MLNMFNGNDVTFNTMPASAISTPARVGHYRWVICALLFFATAINYIDRQVFSILAPKLQEVIGWNEIEYGYIVLSFHVAYALGLVGMGSLMDRIGTRKGVLARDCFLEPRLGCPRLRALCRGLWGRAVCPRPRRGRQFSRCGENHRGMVPEKGTRARHRHLQFRLEYRSHRRAASRALHRREVRLQWAFILTGAFGFVWLAFWLMLYRKPEEHPRLVPAELAYIQSDPAEPTVKIPWVHLWPHRQTWAFSLGKFMTDPVWWFFLFWLPKYFSETYNLELSGLAMPLVVIYVAADIGSIAGGWISSALLKSGRSLNFARKTAMLLCALCVVPMVFASWVDNLWGTVALISLAAAAHQGWSANLYTLVSDAFPRRAVGSVVGIGGMAGAVGNMVASAGIGYLLYFTGNNYNPLLTICSFAYVAALGVIHWLIPRLEPAKVEATAVA